MKFKNIMAAAGSTIVSASVMLSAASITASADTTVGLSAGKYEVPILSVGSAAPLPDVKNAINTVFGDTAVLIVDESGNADIQFTNEHMVINLFGGSYDANIAWVEGATVVSEKTEVYTDTNGNLADAGVHTKENITVPDVFTVDFDLDENNSQTLTVGVDFMAVMMGKAIEEYSTTVTPVLDIDKAERINGFGSAGTRLEPGKYTLPLSMNKATNISSPSMAAGCVKGAVLTVNDDGTADVTVNLQAASAYGLTLWASDWYVYRSDDTSGEKTAAAYTNDSDGNVDSITFRLPDNSRDGVYVNMYIGSPMNVRQDAYFAMDFAGAEPIVETTVNVERGTVYSEAGSDAAAEYTATYSSSYTVKEMVWTATSITDPTKTASTTVATPAITTKGGITMGMVLTLGNALAEKFDDIEVSAEIR